MIDNLIGDASPTDDAVGPPEFISLTCRAVGANLTFFVAGELDASSASTLTSAVVGALDAGSLHVEVDMRDVTFIDSAGLRALIHGYKAAEKRRGSFVVCEPSTVVHRLLTLTGQLERFTARKQ